MPVVPVEPRPLVRLVDTLDSVRAFPAEARTKTGFALYLAQTGGKHESAKPPHGFDVPVWEVRAEESSGTYRAAYVVHLRRAVDVLHVFQKKAKSGIATPRKELELIRRRLKLAMGLDSIKGGER